MMNRARLTLFVELSVCMSWIHSMITVRLIELLERNIEKQYQLFCYSWTNVYVPF